MTKKCQFPAWGYVCVIRGFDALHDDNCLLFHCGWLGYRTSCQRGREERWWPVVLKRVEYNKVDFNWSPLFSEIYKPTS